MTARVHHVLKARKDNKAAGIKAGDSYYWWKFRFGGKHFSKEAPRRSQLTQSEWLGRAYDTQDSLDELNTGMSPSDIRSAIEQAAQECHDAADEAQERLDAMPEQLQESSTSGQTLQEYVDQFNDWADTLDNVDVPEDDEPAEVDDPGDEPDPEDFEDDDAYQAALSEWETQKDEYDTWETEHDEWERAIEEAIEEAQSASPF